MTPLIKDRFGFLWWLSLAACLLSGCDPPIDKVHAAVMVVTTSNRSARQYAELHGDSPLERQGGAFPEELLDADFKGNVEREAEGMGVTIKSFPPDPFNQNAPMYECEVPGKKGEYQIHIRGGPIRYYRLPNHGRVVASNGPDMDEDITKEVIEKLNGQIYGLLYDPSNGTVSGGDICRVEIPERK